MKTALALASLLALAAPARIAAADAAVRPLTLAEALGFAAEASEAVRIRSLQAGKADALLAEARAARLPRLVLEAAASYLGNPPTGITVHRGELGTFALPGAPPVVVELPAEDLVFVEDSEPTYYKVGATLTQPLYTSGKIAAGVRLAETGRDAAAVDLDRQRRDVRRETGRAWRGAVLAARSLPLLASMRAAYSDVLADRAAAFAEGTATRQAVLDAEASSAALEARIVAAREALATAREALSALTGLPPDGFEPAGAFPQACPDLDQPLLLALAVDGSPDVAAARARREQADAARDLERARSSPRPDLALSIAASVAGQRTPFVGGDWTDTWDWSVVVSVASKATVFDGGSSRDRLDAASADRDAAALAVEQARKLARIALQTAVEKARAAGAAAAERRARLALAVETAKNARVSFEEGVVTREQARLAEVGRLSAAIELEAALAALGDAIGEIEYCTGVPLGMP